MYVFRRLGLFVLWGIISLIFSGCGGGTIQISNQGSSSTPAPQSQWTWLNGSNVANQSGIYGIEGMAAVNNVPAGRHGAVRWMDASGNLWLFGGEEAPSSVSDNFFNDLWRYSDGQWAWIGGANTTNQAGVYGTRGVAASTNIPGARTNAVSWIDNAGNLWLFGGLGLDKNGTSNFLNDLWKYSNGQWTWMGGSDEGIQNQPGVYGMQGVASPSNIPGMRAFATSWSDSAGNLWLFGGSGYDSNGSLGYLNDLWKYSNGEWTWMGGANVVNQLGTYGMQGIAASENVPGSRIEATAWTDSVGNFWLFGGSLGPEGKFDLLNDLWEYSNGEWTWVAGTNSVNQSGQYGTEGIASANNHPGARVSAAEWTDAQGSFWLFGGNGYDSAADVGELNDMWKYSGGQWTWIGGSNLDGRRGIYGNQGMAAPNNIPGARIGEVTWKDVSGNFFLFGGDGYDSNSVFGYLNDVWKFGP